VSAAVSRAPCVGDVNASAEAPTIPAPPLTTRTRDELQRSGRMLARARGIDAMTGEEVRELLVDLALAHQRALELLDELAKRSLPR
jgi:hypothetical protein